MTDDDLREPDDAAVRDLRVPDTDDSKPLSWWRSTVEWWRSKADAKRETGDVKGLPGILSALDTAEAALQRRERQYRYEHPVEPEPEPPNPVREQLDRLDDRRKRLLREVLNAELERRAYASTEPASAESSEADHVGSIAELVDHLLDMADDAVDDEYRRRMAAARPDAAEPEPEPSERAQEPVERPQTAPEPVTATHERSRAAQRRPERGVPMIYDLPLRDPEHDRGWQRIHESERPS